MIGFRMFAAVLLAAATLGLSACGGDDGDADRAASERLQRQGVDRTQADEVVDTARSLREQGFSEADAAKLKAATQGVQQKVTGLQRQIVSITRQVQAGTLSEKTGNARVARLARQIQEEAVRAAEELDRAGALPPSAKAQVEAAKKRLAESAAASEKR